VARASDDLTVFAALVHAPDGSGAKLAALVVFHTGDPLETERDLAPFKAWGSPLLVDIGPMPYPVMNTLLDAGLPDGALNYWLNYLGDDQAEDAIRAAYGSNYERLREVKRRYDPDNVFRLNHNIAPERRRVEPRDPTDPRASASDLRRSN